MTSQLFLCSAYHIFCHRATEILLWGSLRQTVLCGTMKAGKGGGGMAGTVIRMSSKKRHSLQAIHEKIHYITGVEQISKTVQTFSEAEIWLLVYEKYFVRTGGYNSLTVLLSEQGDTQTAEIIATGGGGGIVNQSFGANRKLAKECMQALEEMGFTVESASGEKGPWWE